MINDLVRHPTILIIDLMLRVINFYACVKDLSPLLHREAYFLDLFKFLRA